MMKRIKNIDPTFVLLIALVIAMFTFLSFYDAEAQGAQDTVYIATNGSDSNACTLNQPCRTQSRAENALNILVGSGNRGTILYLPGLYQTGVTVRRSNTVVKADALGDVIIRATGYNKGFSIPDAAVGVWVENIILEDSQSHGFHVTSNNPPENPTILKNNVARYNIRENANGSFENMSCREGGWGSAFKVAVGGRNILLEGNLAQQNCGEAYGITRGINVTLRYNVARDNFSVGFYVDNSNNILVEHNHAWCTGDTRFHRGGNPMRGITLGIEQYSGWGNQMGNVLIEKNFVDGCRGVRMYNYFSGNPPGIVIRDNWFANIWDSPIISVSGATITGNLNATPPQEWFDAFTSMPTPVPVTPSTTPSLTPSRTPTNTSTPIAATFTPTPTYTFTATWTPVPSVTPIIPTETPLPPPTIVPPGEHCELIHIFADIFYLWMCTYD